MSGIVGIWNMDGKPLDRAEAEAMSRLIARRGPDGLGIWHDGPIALGHSMLNTTPESLIERFPLSDPRGRFILTADARIDNREELIADLGLHGPPSQITDGDVILRAFEKWGEDCCRHLFGEYAFAVWNKHTDTLFCGRDSIGIKPFYYHYSPGRFFVFASEIRPLLSFSDVPRELNDRMVGQYLAASLQDATSTFYKGIFRLSPAHTISVSRAGLHSRRYWTLDPSRELNLSPLAAAEGLRETFRQAVAACLRSSYPVGCELSGGLDSSSVACMSAKVLRERGGPSLHTFSSTYEAVPQSNERSYQDAVIAMGGFEPHFIQADRLNPFSYALEMLKLADEPFLCPSLFVYGAHRDAAQRQGVRVLLNGVEGDNVLGYGLGYLSVLLRKGRWLKAAKETMQFAERFGRSKKTVLKQEVVRWLLPDRAVQFRERRLLPRRGAFRFLNQRFASETGVLEGALRLDSCAAAAKRGLLQEWRDMTAPGDSYGLEVWAQAFGGHPVESRFPFYNRRMVEFCMAIPVSHRLQDGFVRLPLRRAMQGILPGKVQWRNGKANFKPVFDRAMRLYGRGILDNVLFDKSVLPERFLEIGKIQTAYRALIAGQNEDSYSIWAAALLGLWLRDFERNAPLTKDLNATLSYSVSLC